MDAFWEAPLDECPPTVILARVAYRIIVYRYMVDPLSFRISEHGIIKTANLLQLDGFEALAATVRSAAAYCARHNRKLKLWRFDVMVKAGKAYARRQDPRWRAYDRGYPRITNRGVASDAAWLEALPDHLRPVNEAFYEAHR